MLLHDFIMQNIIMMNSFAHVICHEHVLRYSRESNLLSMLVGLRVVWLCP